MNTTLVLSKFEELPLKLKMDVSNYMDFLISKSTKQNSKNVPKFGSAKGKITLSPDFDEPIDDFKDYM